MNFLTQQTQEQKKAMLFQGLSKKVTRARPTSNSMFSAAAIAVVSEVNPDEPGASLLSALLSHVKHSALLRKALLGLFLFSSMATTALAQADMRAQRAMQNATYNNKLIDVTPMLFHHINLGMSYEAVLSLTGKAPLYCDSGESYCETDHGSISRKCLETEFIQPNKIWMCHWDGKQVRPSLTSRLEVWFTGPLVTQVAATMPDGSVYRRDSGNTIHLERH